MLEVTVPRNSNSSIWKLVENCAHELVAGGLTPFTRGGLIACVQTKNPDCAVNSINPIIQGITDNLRGGAPGAVGKNVLHSVGRGRFELMGAGSAACTGPKIDSPRSSSNTNLGFGAAYREEKTVALGAERKMSLGGYEFAYVSEIDPLRSDDGHVLGLYPQDRYANLQDLSLNKYGKGRVFATTLGHNMLTVGQDEYHKLLANGLLWSCDKLDANGNPAAGYEGSGKE